MYSFKEGITPSSYKEEDMSNLVEQGFFKNGSITSDGEKLMRTLDSYFIKLKKKTASSIMGKDYLEKVKSYREIFPAKKLPSGVPARNNVKILTENFRWFFNEFDYNWDEVLKATERYVKEYSSNEYLYMQNSQFFISKQDKHRVKSSKLADYCDMIRDNVKSDDDFHFKEKVV